MGNLRVFGVHICMHHIWTCQVLKNLNGRNIFSELVFMFPHILPHIHTPTDNSLGQALHTTHQIYYSHLEEHASNDIHSRPNHLYWKCSKYSLILGHQLFLQLPTYKQCNYEMFSANRNSKITVPIFKLKLQEEELIQVTRSTQASVISTEIHNRFMFIYIHKGKSFLFLVIYDTYRKELKSN